MKLSKEFLMESLSTKGAVQINVKNDRNIDVPINVVIFNVDLQMEDQGIGGYEYGGATGVHVDNQLVLNDFEYHFYNDEYKVDNADYYESLVQTGMWKNNDFNGFLSEVEKAIEDYIYENEDDFIPEKDVPDLSDYQDEPPYNWG